MAELLAIHQVRISPITALLGEKKTEKDDGTDGDEAGRREYEEEKRG